MTEGSSKGITLNLPTAFAQQKLESATTGQDSPAKPRTTGQILVQKFRFLREKFFPFCHLQTITQGPLEELGWPAVTEVDGIHSQLVCIQAWLIVEQRSLR